METKQAGIFRHIVGIIPCCLCLRRPSRAVHVQHQLKKALDLLLVQRKLFGELAQLVQHLRILRTASVILDKHCRLTVVAMDIKKLKINVYGSQFAQLFHGALQRAPVILCDKSAPILRDALK